MSRFFVYVCAKNQGSDGTRRLTPPHSSFMNLPSLPFDILLVVFRDLDVIDIIRAGVVSPLQRSPFLMLAENPPLGCPRLVRPSTRPYMTDTSGSISSKSRIKRIRHSGLPRPHLLPSLPKSLKPSSRDFPSCASVGSKATVKAVLLRKALLESPEYANSGSCLEENPSFLPITAET